MIGREDDFDVRLRAAFDAAAQSELTGDAEAFARRVELRLAWRLRRAQWIVAAAAGAGAAIAGVQLPPLLLRLGTIGETWVRADSLWMTLSPEVLALAAVSVVMGASAILLQRSTT